MKKITILLILILISISFNAQNMDTKIADNLFNRYEFANAAIEYQSLYEKGILPEYVSKQLGETYYNMSKTIEAENWYAIALQKNQDAETVYQYAQTLKSNGKYKESDVQMRKFASILPKDKRALDFEKNPNYLSKLSNDTKKYTVEKININSDKSDFGAVLFDNILYLSSARNKNNAIYAWNDEPFLDLYQSNYNSDGTFTEPTLVSELNTKYHEGPLSISKDRTTVYFSSESFNDDLFEKDKTKKLNFGQVSLYKATKDGEKWTSITSLPFNSKNYSVSNPSIDKKGTTLYFSSNMPGSIGGIDIWKVSIYTDGSYGTPENLGDKINTPGDESFPFISDDNQLYFSSNGLLGYGGFDIFTVNLNDTSIPSNMGNTINTGNDDFAFSFDNEKNLGFISSNRSGEDNIYSIKPVCTSQIIVNVTNNKTSQLLVDSKVMLSDNKNSIYEPRNTNQNGKVTYDVSCQKPYSIEVRKDGFITKSLDNIDTSKGGITTVDVTLDPIEVIVTEKEIILNPIYFEFSKSDITIQGATELDKLVYVLSQNDELVIFVKSHTDSRGDEDYNMNLSEQRAKSTVDYIISKGINTNQISGKGFGESEPKFACGDNCTDEEHALNRRSEFIIVKK